jgi:two-component system, chemotaxis family, CheB/CheR fusion protein
MPEPGPQPTSKAPGTTEPRRCPVVGVGASAGGLPAFKNFLAHTPQQTGIAFVLIQHLSPGHESALVSLLAPHTAMPVVEARDGMRVEPDHVYVIAPSTNLSIEGGVLRVVPQTEGVLRHPIDVFLLSVAESGGQNAAAVILTGAGHDGTLGLKAVKEQGGLTIAQTAETADHDSMLRSAVRTGLVDFQLRVEDIPARLVQYFNHLKQVEQQSQGSGLREPSAPELQQICNRLRAVTGHDFSEYKDRTLVRRIQRRMQVHELIEVQPYIDLLHREPGECEALFKDLLIGVTQFFRDPESFEVLAKDVIHKLVADKGPGEQIRVWVAGCATGEEAYSLAMVLREALDGRADPPGIQIIASDIDEDALQFARVGRYPGLIARDVSPERLERFFVKEDGAYRVRRTLRDICVFAHHSILRDPPFSRMHLISCRNLLIYLSPELQARLLPVLHYALQPGGHLLLGPSENIGRHTKLFAPLDKKRRIFARCEDGIQHLPKFPLARHEEPSVPASRLPAVHRPPTRAETLARKTEAILAKYAPAYVIINQDYEIVSASRRTGRFLELGGGRPDLNLLTMARGDLRLELRAAVHQAGRSRKKVVHRSVPVTGNGETQAIDLIVEPLRDGEQARHHYVIVFQDVTPSPRELAGQREPGDEPGAQTENETIAQLEGELRATREHLQTVAEELETSNEELRSSNEELSSVNEELQSTNEELQTSKEELQSINEELQTVNLELNSHVDDLTRTNNYLKNLLENIRLPMVFLDNELRVRNFTPSATELFSLRESDAGRPITDINSELDYRRLSEDIASVRRSRESVEREIETSTGATYIMRVLLYRTTEDDIDGIILTFTDITERRHGEEQQKLLVAELSHRVKNTLATVQSIAAQTMRHSSSLEDFYQRFSGRLHALGRAHSLLTDRNWRSLGLRDVVLEPLRAHMGEAERIRVRGDDIDLRPSAALALGMVIHELATNATKHGALSNTSGRVEVDWGLTRGDDERHVQLLWRERNGPELKGPAEHGFGLTLIERGVSYELQGHTRLEFAPEGLTCELQIPYTRENFDL